MDQVRRLLMDITAAREGGEIRLSAGRNYPEGNSG